MQVETVIGVGVKIWTLSGPTSGKQATWQRNQRIQERDGDRRRIAGKEGAISMRPRRQSTDHPDRRGDLRDPHATMGTAGGAAGDTSSLRRSGLKSELPGRRGTHCREHAAARACAGRPIARPHGPQGICLRFFEIFSALPAPRNQRGQHVSGWQDHRYPDRRPAHASPPSHNKGGDAHAAAPFPPLL